MNRTLSLSIAVAACTFIGQAFADDITVDPSPFTPGRTRAEVQAELQEYRASGVDLWADNYNPVAGLQSNKTRAQVKAEYIAERDKVAAFGGEDSGSAWMAHAARPSQDIQMAGDPQEMR
jgi:hypothetical protein